MSTSFGTHPLFSQYGHKNCDDDEKELPEIPQQELLQSLGRLHESSEYSDLTIECGDRSYQVHRSIILPRCSVPMLVLEDNDGQRRVDLTEEDPIAVRLMIHYLYNLDYPRLTHAEVKRTKVAWEKQRVKSVSQSNGVRPLNDYDPILEEPVAAVDSWSGEVVSEDPENAQDLWGTKKKKKKKEKVSRSIFDENQKGRETDEDRAANLLIHVRMYMISGKYGIKGLQHLAKVRFAKDAFACVELPGFLEAAEIIYGSTYAAVLQGDWVLQDQVVGAIRKTPSVLDNKDTQGLLIKTPELSLRLLLQQNGYTRKT